MNKVDEKLELGGTQYYQIICLLSEQKNDGKWLARVRVLRKDTKEYVGSGFTIFDYAKETVIKSAIKKTNVSLLPELEKKGVPLNWNSEVRRVLVCCKKIYSDVMDFGCYAADFMSSQKVEGESLARYPTFWKKLIKDSVSLSKKIESLSLIERIDLLTISESSFEDPSDAWSLEDIDLSIFIFDFFANPTDKEKELYELQKERLSDRFKEPGWTE